MLNDPSSQLGLPGRHCPTGARRRIGRSDPDGDHCRGPSGR